MMKEDDMKTKIYTQVTFPENNPNLEARVQVTVNWRTHERTEHTVYVRKDTPEYPIPAALALDPEKIKAAQESHDYIMRLFGKA